MKFIKEHLPTTTRNVWENTSGMFDDDEEEAYEYGCWTSISSNPNITMEFIENHLEEPWDWNWNDISSNPNITMEMIKKHTKKPWKWSSISSNPNLTLEFIEKHINKIDLGSLSENKFTLINSKEPYMLLEKERSFHKLMNLYIIKNYM